jgi:predicted amidohydrolase YtcJ
MDHFHLGRRELLLAAAGSAVAGALPRHASASSRGAADLVLHGGQVLVMDRAFTVAEAVALRDGRVVHVGDDHSVRRFVGRRTEVVDLAGRTALPGINDSHLHGLRTGLSLPPYNVNTALDSIVDIAASVGTAATPAPPGGVIVKDAAGEPTGLLLETAMGLVNAHIPAFTEAEQADAVERNIDVLLSLGITSYTEPGLGALAQRLYADKANKAALRVRVTGLASRADDTFPVSADQVREILAAPGPDTDPRWFAMTGVKLRADGVPIGSGTAWMREPYVGGGRGSLVTAGDTDEAKVAELTAMIGLVHRAGPQVGTHATGDAAIDAVAAAYAKARHRRHYVIHGDFAWPETLRLLASSGCGVSLNHRRRPALVL